ncbi:MAG: PAS domain S-box protein [Kiloniellales bacterium]
MKALRLIAALLFSLPLCLGAARAGDLPAPDGQVLLTVTGRIAVTNAPDGAGDREGSGKIVARLSPLLPDLRRVTVQVAQSELDRLAAGNTMRRNALWTALASLGGLVIALVLLVGILRRENRQRKHLAREAQKAERVAQDSEARFRDIVEAASDWVWETDAEHRLTFISDRLRQLSGEEPSEVIGKTRFDLRLAGDVDPVWEYHR